MTQAAISIDDLERRGDFAKAHERAVADGDWVRASEFALYSVGVDDAKALAERALAEAKEPAEQIAAQLALARVELRRHSADSLEVARAALARADDLGARNLRSDPRLAGRYFKLLGLASARGGHARDAVEAFAEGYRRCEGDASLRARILLTWAVQLRNWGLLDEARRKAERSLEIRLELGDDHGAAMCHGTLAMIYSRLGLYEMERNALAADMRICERLGADAEIPGLRARLAGALVGLGKYASAAREAEEAISSAGDKAASTGFAYRELARVAHAQSRTDEALGFAEKGGALFAELGNRYGAALCVLTECDIRLSAAKAAATEDEVEAAVAAILERFDAARPTFTELGAIQEAAELLLIRNEALALRGMPQAREAAALLVRQVVPTLEQTGLGQTATAVRVREAISRLSPSEAFDQIASRAALLRGSVAVMVDGGPQPATVVVADLRDEDRARQFATAAIDHGAIMGWPGDTLAMAVLVGAGHVDRGHALCDLFQRDAVHMASGDIDIEPMWPAPPRVRGPAITAALDKIRAARST